MFIIHHNGLGSRKGLVSSHQLEEETPSLEAVVEAFTRVYKFLSEHIDAADQELIRFDPIMVEHLLCKFHKTRLFRSKLK